MDTLLCPVMRGALAYCRFAGLAVCPTFHPIMLDEYRERLLHLDDLTPLSFRRSSEFDDKLYPKK
jgi:hypothetical protein